MIHIFTGRRIFSVSKGTNLYDLPIDALLTCEEHEVFMGNFYISPSDPPDERGFHHNDGGISLYPEEAFRNRVMETVRRNEDEWLTGVCACIRKCSNRERIGTIAHDGQFTDKIEIVGAGDHIKLYRPGQRKWRV